MINDTATIVAQATPPGIGGVGVIRLSGKDALSIANKIFDKPSQYFSPRVAKLVNCLDQEKEIIDKGLALYFPKPNSFTGEDVIEFHCHGGPVVVDIIIKTMLLAGARQARPGEFSERAFLNDKIDLVQAEAIADLIDSSSEQAARNAIKSLQGVFSKQIHSLVESLTQLRIYIEAAIDFPDEEGVEFLSDGKVEKNLFEIIEELSLLIKEAGQGVIVQEGMSVVLVGEPNVGKSSLLNTLSRQDSAIVTDIAGTTRDVLKEKIDIDGMPVHIIDTAGLRESEDPIEQEGIKRAWNEIEKADQILYLIDSRKMEKIKTEDAWATFVARLPNTKKVCLIENKIDLSGKLPEQGFIEFENSKVPYVRISIKRKQGLEGLKLHLKRCMGYETQSEGSFAARRRHLEALNAAADYLNQGKVQLVEMRAGELLAEDLRLAQQKLGEITGDISSDDLLGRIFSSFCIGK